MSPTQIFVIGPGPIGATEMATTTPTHLSLTIPQKIALKKYLLTAWGTTSDKRLIVSAGTTIDVERPDLPKRLRADPNSIFFADQSGDEPLKVYANFTDEPYVDVSESSNLTFESSEPAVATVDSFGVIKPVSQGTATIMASYVKAAKSVSVSIPVKVPEPIVSVSPKALDFGGQIVGTKSVPRTVILTGNTYYSPLRVGTSLRSPQFGPGDPNALGVFSKTDNCVALSPIAIGKSCTAEILFTPAAPGPYTGTLYVATSLNGLTAEVELTGNGVVSIPTDPGTQERQPTLRITSPTDNTVVNPGQPVSIHVISPSETSVSTVSVVGEVPLGTPPATNSLPAQFILTIPPNIEPRRYAIAATARANNGEVLHSNYLTLDVERPDLPTELRILGTAVTFVGPTGSFPLTIHARFSDGAYLDVTKSSNLSFTSSNPAIVMVDANGTMKPLAPGTAKITATYAHSGKSVSISFPATVPVPKATLSPGARK